MRISEIIRYYQAGIVNTAFGYGAYAALLWGGVAMYPAQFVAHIAGMAFNYMTYSRHVFRDGERAMWRFAASYLVNYLASVATLAGLSRLISSPYLAGLATVAIISVANYFVLKRLVFRSSGDA